MGTAVWRGKGEDNQGEKHRKQSKERNQAYVMPTKFDLKTAEKDAAEDRRREVVKKRKPWMR